LEKTITKDILKKELYAGQRPAVELLYTRYSGMLFGYYLSMEGKKKSWLHGRVRTLRISAGS